MCGIAGIYQQNGKILSADVAREMGAIMTHRGPDNFGVYQRGRIAMTHNRLSLLDLSEAANQPFFNDNFVLSYNGEIYNFQEIRQRLTREYNVEFRTTSDTEVLFYSLIHDGIDKCLDQIKGMFAFAFYDHEHERLYLARDRVGIKPLYYYQTADGFHWASEVKAIAIPLGLTPDPIRTLFATNNMAEKSTTYTLFKGLTSVRPGCYMSIGPGAVGKETVYYDVLNDFDRSVYRDLDSQPVDRVLTTFDDMFTRSVDGMLVSDAPVGAFVSGGIDSSLISAIAVKCDADIKLFTANVLGKYSEFSDVEILSKYLNKQVFEFKFEHEMMLRDWVDVTYYYDCPIVIHVNAIPFAGVAKLAHDSGVKAVLTGEGADELFLGYPELLARRYKSLASFPVNAVKSLYKLSPKLHKFLFPEIADSPLTFINNLVQGFHQQRFHEKADEKLAFLSDTKRAHQYQTLNMIQEHLVTLLHRNDRVGMMSSIEARFPFLDEEIVKFAINLPSKFKAGRSAKFHNYKHPFLIDKWIVRKTAEKYLPAELVAKRKIGFPMYGHKFIKIERGFFENGWVAETLGLGSDVQDSLIDTQDPYFVAKLASVEIFGRIFAFKQPLDEVKDHVARYANISPAHKPKKTLQQGQVKHLTKAVNQAEGRKDALPGWLSEIRGSSRDRYFSTKGNAWIRFHKWGFMRFPPNDITAVCEDEKKELFLKTKAAIISNHHLPGPDERANSTLYLCSDKDYDISKLSANNRSKVRRGSSRLSFGRVEPSTVAERGYLCYRDTCLRNGIAPISESAFKLKWNKDEPQPASREIFAVFAGDDIAALGIVWICGRWAEIFSTQSANKYLKDYSNHALFFNILSNLLGREEIENVSYGLSSVQPESKLDTLHHFKLSVNFEALPVVRTLTVNPLLKPAVNKATLKCARMLQKSFPNSRHLLAARGALELVFGDEPLSAREAQ